MKLRFLEAAAGWRSLLVALLLHTPSTYAANDNLPKVTANKFDQKPMNVVYFKDSDVVLFQDFMANTIFRSENAGETWDMIKDIPKGDGWDLWLHPIDPKRAYVITRESTHYKTNDRGKTWKTFKTDLAPSMFRVPLTFHASEPDKILFNGMDCKNALWCTEEVSYMQILACRLLKLMLHRLDKIHNRWFCYRFQTPPIRYCGLLLGEDYGPL